MHTNHLHPVLLPAGSHSGSDLGTEQLFSCGPFDKAMEDRFWTQKESMAMTGLSCNSSSLLVPCPPATGPQGTDSLHDLAQGRTKEKSRRPSTQRAKACLLQPVVQEERSAWTSSTHARMRTHTHTPLTLIFSTSASTETELIRRVELWEHRLWDPMSRGLNPTFMFWELYDFL